MKRVLVIVLIFCVVFTACDNVNSDNYMQSALDFRRSLMQSGGCSFVSQVNAVYGERVYDFTMDCQYFTDQKTRLTIIAPETISGISAAIDKEGASVEFDDIMLDFGTMANGHIAPMALPWIIGKAWNSGYVQSAGRDGDMIVVDYLLGYGDEELMVQTAFSSDMLPVSCDIFHGGVRYLTVSITDFRLN